MHIALNCVSYMNESINEHLHLLTKLALKGNEETAELLINILLSLEAPQIRAIAYLLVYQIIMNTYIDLTEECKKCGGVCCKFGEPIELYSFDVEDLKSIVMEFDNYVIKNCGKVYLPRPCPFQNEWACSVHNVKPYACLSYPFAVENLQKDVISSYTYSHPPRPFIPHFCLAGQKVWNIIDSTIKDYKFLHGKEPLPQDLLKYTSKKLKVHI